MGKLVFVSNRLPVTVGKADGKFTYKKSIGGLATGLKSYHEQSGSVWAGWPGIADELVGSAKDKEGIRKECVEKYNCLPVFLTEEEISRYYHGFCNKTIWPLFHYFTNKAEYDGETWEAYKDVNRKFFETVAPAIGESDTVWVHDYQLMLLPGMIKERFPNARVGFFLHIPFPSFEIFRLLVWREEILRGLLGADLIGFHTYDYVRHFLSSAGRLLGLEHSLNRISYEDRFVHAEAFPMGIDYERFSRNFTAEDFPKDVRDITVNASETRTILSIDRLDYTKGIPQRLRAFRHFLSKYPEYREKVRFNLIVAPSRVEVESYDKLRREITELVSEINGEYGTVSWMPIWFFFQTFSQDSLIAFYKTSDVLLVTPMRDGMNLVAKEYVAARTDFQGMLVISETAGAASELGEAVVVNANDENAIAEGIRSALEMPQAETTAINRRFHKRLRRYNVDFWAGEFLDALNRAFLYSVETIPQKNIQAQSGLIESHYQKADNRILFLDYDGTLVGFRAIPEKARPDRKLRLLLSELAADTKNTVVVVSGRDRFTLEQWLGDLNLNLIASHGLWVRRPGQGWTMTIALDNSWKESVAHILELYADRMPGSLIEEKEYSLAFHYRQCDPDMAAVKLGEVRAALMSMTGTMNLGIQEGNKVIEIKDNRVSKGFGASLFLREKDYGFILGVGDDRTDEDLFTALPEDAFTIKIGLENTAARYRLKSWQSTRALLQKLIAQNGK
ncbi:MAG: bifunctional alpha,alpha-trehalose-phosphate synthase (UDP-forming)/trehalose-phosphatase [Christensenellales bacterium]|jgi:trehalose 6-phosphate synthase/phosphatase